MKDRASSPFCYLSKLSHHLPHYLSYIFFSFHMTIPCLPSWLLQISSVKSHSDHVRKMYPTTLFTGCSRALEANVHCLLQTAACFTNPLHEQEKPRNWHITGMVISNWWGRVLTGQINLPKSGNIHLLKPLVYFLLYFTAPYLLTSSSPSWLISSDTLLLSSCPQIRLLENLNSCIPLWSAHHLTETSTLKYGVQLPSLLQIDTSVCYFELFSFLHNPLFCGFLRVWVVWFFWFF